MKRPAFGDVLKEANVLLLTLIYYMSSNVWASSRATIGAHQQCSRRSALFFKLNLVLCVTDICQ
jgi:hypothetical protein